MSHNTTRIERAVFADVQELKYATVRDVMASGQFGCYQYVLRALNNLTAKGYLLCSRGFVGGNLPKVWEVTPGANMPKGPPEAGGNRSKDDPFEKRRIDRQHGDIPADLLARLTLAGMCEQLIKHCPAADAA